MKKWFASGCGRVVEIGLVALIIFAPLALGCVETWAITILESTIFAIGCAWLVARACTGRPRTGTGLEIPILLFLGVVFFQLVPWPRAILTTVSPRIVGLYERTVPGYAGPAEGFEPWLMASDAARTAIAPAPRAAAGGAWMPASYSPPDTIERLVLFGALAIVFLVVSDHYRDTRRRRGLIMTMAFAGMGVAVLALAQKLSWNGKILWIRPVGSARVPFGPFVNPNHFAGYMELVVPLALGILLTLLSRRAQHAYRLEAALEAGRQGGQRARRTMTALLGVDPERLPWIATSRTPKAVLLGFLLLIALGSIVLSLSRGGFIALLATFALFARALVPGTLRGRVKPALAATCIVLATIVLGAAFLAGASAISERSTGLGGKTVSAYFDRSQAWGSTLDLVRDHVALGTGLGAFSMGFAGYYPAGTDSVWRETHNDYLQLLAEVGVAGFIPAFLALFVFGRRHVLAGVRERGAERYLRIGLAMAIVSMLLHSFVDFNLQVPAIGFLFVVIGSLLVAAHAPPDDEPEASPSPVRMGMRLAGAALLAACTLVVAVQGVGASRAESAVAAAWNTQDPQQALRVLEITMASSPGRPGVLSAFGDQALKLFDREYRDDASQSAAGRALLDKAERAFLGALQIGPLSAWNWWGLGEVYAGRASIARLERPIGLEDLSRTREAELGSEARLALAALRTAMFLEPNYHQIHDEMALLYRQEGLRADALASYGQAAQIMPRYDSHDFGPVADLPADLYRAIARGMEGALRSPGVIPPEEIQKELGQMAYLRRDLAEAEKRYRISLLESRTRAMTDEMAGRLGEVLRQEGKSAEAIPMLERAAAGRGASAGAWLSLGRLRADAGDHAGAMDAYRKARAASPGNVWAEIFLAQEMARAGEKGEAVDRLRYVVQSHASSTPARKALIQLLREDGRSNEALAEAEALAQVEPAAEASALVEELRREVARK